MSNAFRKRGHECFTVDWNEKFPSNLHIDIEKLTAETILEKFGQPDVVWIGTDCTSYSIAAISHHRKKNPTTGNLDPISDYAKKCDRMNQHVKQLVKQLNPKLLCEHIVDICEEYMCEENLFDECKSCENKYSSMECDMCENFDMYK